MYIFVYHRIYYHLPKTALRRTNTLPERQILLDSLLFWLNTTPRKESAVSAERCVDRTITFVPLWKFLEVFKVSLKHLTIHENFFIPDLIHYLRAYFKGYHIQLHRNEKSQPRHLQHRITPKYKAMTMLSMDLKGMLISYTGLIFYLVVMYKVTYLK